MSEKAAKSNTQTPMMKQWLSLKAQAGEALLFFRLGDFYELFGDDAVKAAPVMGVTLTARGGKGKKEDAVPLCGVPIANYEGYLNKLLNAGIEVALAEQIENPSPEKKIVARDIVQGFTPGIRLLPSEEQPHYAAVVSGKESKWAFAAADISTGHLVIECGQGLESLADLCQRLPVEDLRIAHSESFEVPVQFKKYCHLLPDAQARQKISSALGLNDWSDSPSQNHLETQTLGTLISILEDYHPREKIRLLRPNLLPNSVWMGSSTRRHLHLFDPDNHSLFRFIDKTKTSMGRRELKMMLAYPSSSIELIRERQSLVRYFKENSLQRKDFRKALSQVQDLHRLMRRRKNPPVLFQITQSLKHSMKADEVLDDDSKLKALTLLRLRSRALSHLVEKLESSLQYSDNKETGWIAKGVSSELDELRDLQQNANSLLSKIELELRELTGVNTLRVKFHQVFGYVAELSSQHKSKIPEGAEHVQTLANSHRFRTDSLKELEEKILSLNSRIEAAEESLIQDLFEKVDEAEDDILKFCSSVAYLDCIQSLAECSAENNWQTPRTSLQRNHLSIDRGSHPLTLESFVPLTFELKQSGTQLMLLTGPNMAGKSTVLRVAAIISILHQIGSDVPAEDCELSIFDRIMCRMGASDDLTTGKSTFYVEMREVATMLSGASERSLLLFDEIGRGTSTYDGMSLAWAIAEAVHDLGALSMVATHYLELAQLERQLAHLQNFHLGVEEKKGVLVFTRCLEPGPASQSYGIQVARLADVPENILRRAEQKLSEFEKKRSRSTPLFELVSSRTH